MTFHRIFNKKNMMGAISGTETAFPFGTSEFTSVFLLGSVIFSFLCSILWSIVLFVLFLFVIVLSIYLRFKASGYPFGILKTGGRRGRDRML
jgi:hypothetical protein